MLATNNWQQLTIIITFYLSQLAFKNFAVNLHEL